MRRHLALMPGLSFGSLAYKAGQRATRTLNPNWKWGRNVSLAYDAGQLADWT